MLTLENAKRFEFQEKACVDRSLYRETLIFFFGWILIFKIVSLKAVQDLLLILNAWRFGKRNESPSIVKSFFNQPIKSNHVEKILIDDIIMHNKTDYYIATWNISPARQKKVQKYLSNSGMYKSTYVTKKIIRPSIKKKNYWIIFFISQKAKTLKELWTLT